MTAARKLVRCAIYTRKSTEHNLDLEFNSLDAQRESCEAYIKSQAPEGWRLVPDHYDDGGLSGASLERPALQTLLLALQAGKVDTVVVYKVDRLTRSLADFAKLVELFDRHGVSFVSVTQAFNTTSSMGRLTLNVLLSFAQFEREVIGERVRDKISASKRKGLWVGGPISLGYASVEKKLVVVPKEAETVRTIFHRYLELGSIGSLIEDLHLNGVLSKRRQLKSGRVIGGGRFGVGALAHLLNNRFYIGEIAYRGEIHQGDHEPILDRELFEAVQSKLNANSVERRLRIKGSASILTGLIFDDRGNRMTPSHSNKRGIRYRYYVSQALLQRRQEEIGQVARVPAPEIEATVVRAVRAYAESHGLICPETGDDQGLVEQHIGRVMVKAGVIEVTLLQTSDGNDRPADTCSAEENNEPVILRLPWTTQSFTAVKGLTKTLSDRPTLSSEKRDTLLGAIAKARLWVDELYHGRVTSISEIAQREGKVDRHIRLLAALAFVSPKVIELIAGRLASEDLTVTELARVMPASWEQQVQLVSPPLSCAGYDGRLETPRRAVPTDIAQTNLRP